MKFLLGVVEGLFRTEQEDPAVRRAVRMLESALIAAAVIFARSKGMPV